MKNDDAFQEANYYDLPDQEYLTHGDPEEAIEAILDAEWWKGETIVETIERYGDLTLAAYARAGVSSGWITGVTDSLHEYLEEFFCDEYNIADPWSEAEHESIRVLLESAVKLAATTGAVWRCDEVARRTYNVEELKAIAQRNGWGD